MHTKWLANTVCYMKKNLLISFDGINRELEGMDDGGVDGLLHLEYTNFLSMGNKESIIVSAIIPVHVLRKQGEIKAAPFFTKPRHWLGHCHNLNWLNSWISEEVVGFEWYRWLCEYCSIALEDKILVLFVVFGVVKHALHYCSQGSFCVTKKNTVARMLLYDKFRLQTVT